jgi:hypothetical protein
VVRSRHVLIHKTWISQWCSWNPHISLHRDQMNPSVTCVWEQQTTKTTFLPLHIDNVRSYSAAFHLFSLLCADTYMYLLSGGWSPTGSTRHGGHWLAYCSLLRVIMMMENLMEWRLTGETEVLVENPPQRHFVHYKFHFTRPEIESGPPRWEASD